MTWTLPTRLPKGRRVSAGPDATPVLWISDKLRRDAPARWQQLFRERGSTGLWPLLLRGLGAEFDDVGHDRPWRSGELAPIRPVEPDSHDPARVLVDLWQRGFGPLSGVSSLSQRPPSRPNLTAALPLQCDADACAIDLAQQLGPAMLGLVPARGGSEALATCGWRGAGAHASPGELASVLRSWEERFAVSVVAAGFATLTLAVAAPPMTYAEAEAVAAEHQALCPDVSGHVPVARPPGPVRPAGSDFYLLSLIGSTRWHLCWA